MSGLQSRLPPVTAIARARGALQRLLVDAAHDGRTRPVDRAVEQRLELGDVHGMQGQRLVTGRCQMLRLRFTAVSFVRSGAPVHALLRRPPFDDAGRTG